MELSDSKLEFYLLALGFKRFDAFNNICSMFETSDFSEERHRLIYQAYQALYKADQKLNVEILSDFLGSNISKVGNLNYLIELNEAGEVYDFDYLKDKIKEKTHLRNILAYCYQTSKQIEVSTDYDTLVMTAASSAYKLFDHIEDSKPKTIREVLQTSHVYDEAVLRQQAKLEGREIPFRGLRTNFLDLDNVIGGLIPGQLIVIGARPGAGKTSLMLNLANNLPDKNIMIFSLEMTNEELVKKLVFLNAEIDERKYRNGLLKNSDIQNIYGISSELNKRHLTLDETPGIRPVELLGRARAIKSTKGLDAIFVDYLQLMKGDEKRYESNEVRVASISRELKAIAKKLEVPIVTLAQLNRDVEKRTDRDPVVSDLRESGSLEADADIVLLLIKPESIESENAEATSLTVKIAKNRHGEEGKITLFWNKVTGKMENIQKSMYQ